MKILFVTSGQLPVPAVDGGAVETLIDNYVRENELTGENDLTVISSYSKKAAFESKEYKKAKFLFVTYKISDKIKDNLIFLWHTYVTKNWQVMFLKNKWKKRRFEKFLFGNTSVSEYDRIIIENNMSLLPVLKAKMGINEFREKCYYHMHSVFIDNPSCITELVECKAVLTVSEFVKNQICADYPELKNATVKVVKNGIDKNAFMQADKNVRIQERSSYSISDKDTVFLYVGRISPEKGVLELIRAFKSLKIDNKKLLLAGCSYQGEKKKSFYEKEVDSSIEQSEGVITKIGYISNDKISSLYNMADILVIPSIVGDAGPLTLLEAMSCGMTIVASKVGGMPEYSKDYSKIKYAVYNDNFVENLSQKMSEAVSIKDNSFSKKEFVYDRKFYYDELNRVLR